MQTQMGPIQGFYGLGGVTKFTFNGVGKAWFVDSVLGEDSNSFGKTFTKALATIGEAVDRASAGDTIYMKGSFNEAVTVDKAGLRFVGVGTCPRETQWTAPTVAGSWCAKVSAAYCLFENIYFKPVIYTSSGVPSGIYLDAAGHTKIRGCRFQGQTGSYKAIYSPVCQNDNVQIIGNDFMYMNTATHGAAIYGVEADGLSYSGWKIVGNVFSSCVTAVDINGRCCLVKDNVFAVGGITAAGAVNAAVCTMALDLSGTSSGGNMVTGNMFAGEFDSDLYVAGAAGDCWVGNTTLIEAVDAPYGLTVTDPAAED